MALFVSRAVTLDQMLLMIFKMAVDKQSLTTAFEALPPRNRRQNFALILGTRLCRRMQLPQ
jgi:hypothetical protein